ncbi:tyrosine-protein phosphatase non-receptor type 21 isoform X2 [Hydra vulgaris]|uniref:protein-tyrosine-phosphatase n=1 Tax=Hydra vulgaris TaxID=6087 RepID=A0ABM4C3Z7_HYDVU
MPLKLLRNGHYAYDKLYTLHIPLLDNTVMNINVPLASKGKDCLQKIAQYIGLYEIEYFGLQFLTKKEKLHWVDLDKCLRKQLDRHKSCKGTEAILLFKVQFFVPNCCTLQQEITRYLYYLQLKSLILSGKLKCNLGIALRLAALAVQAELGANETTESKVQDLDQFILLPFYLTHKEDENRLHEEILLLHKENRYDTMTAADAEKAYIQLCYEIPQYGCEIFNGKDKDALLVEVGASYHGIHIAFVNKEKAQKVYEWKDIGDMSFNRQNFVLQNSKTGETFTVDMGDNENAKYFWKVCISQHKFFRISGNFLARTAFRTQKEISTDAAMLINVQESPEFKRRVTLTKKNLSVKSSSPNKSPSSSASGSVHINSDNSSNISLLLSNTLDEAEFLHRYEDLLSPTRERGNSSISHGSTPASSDYNSSDSDREVEFNYCPISSVVNEKRRPASLIITRLSRIASEHRDLLLKHLEQLLENNQISEEYQQIFCEKTGYTTVCGSSQVLKNRNCKVLPYDDNRILLPQDNIDGSDYVNASLIKINRRQSFIAAQSPLQQTTNDFWSMIWNEKINVIVMMSKLKERGEEICFPYWPTNNDVVAYNQVKVKQNFVKTYENYIVRRLVLQHDFIDKTQTLFHFQYNQWPVDYDVPKSSKPIIEFINEIHSIQKLLSNSTSSLQPLLVHCEDGSSRTGVFILVSTLFGIIERNETLDIPITLAELRMQRMHLVGSVQQYKFVYTVLIDYLRQNRLI